MIHTIIKVERRTGSRANSKAITAHSYDDKGKIIATFPTQLHTIGERIDDASNITYAAEWDGKAPYVVVTVGNIADIKMAFLGWPCVTEEEWRSANPPPQMVQVP